MGLLHDGEWEPEASREQYDHDAFDDRIEVASNMSNPVESGRYHLYICRVPTPSVFLP